MDMVDYFKNSILKENDGATLLKHRNALQTKLRTGGANGGFLMGQERADNQVMLRAVLNRMAVHPDFQNPEPISPKLPQLEPELAKDRAKLDKEAYDISMHLIGKKRISTKATDNDLRDRLMSIHQGIIALETSQSESKAADIEKKRAAERQREEEHFAKLRQQTEAKHDKEI